MLTNREPKSELDQDVYAVILAGGSGTRFWPKSRHLTPKQLCKIGSEEATMLETTLARLDGFIPKERRFIVTHVAQAEATRALVGARCAAVLAEPEARNTANALALAALHLRAIHKAPAKDQSGPIMISLHADHVVRKVEAFQAALRQAVRVARQDYLTLLGLIPQYPETGYGYIERGGALAGLAGCYEVASFREKPALELASEYVASGKFYWNAGLFTWRVDRLITELQTRLPATMTELTSLLTSTPAATDRGFAAVAMPALARCYQSLPKISIDHAVLEVSDRVAVVEADIGWQDVGSWDALARCFPTDQAGNLVFGDALLIDTQGTTVDTDGPFVAVLGSKDQIVVCAKGAVLVCPKEKAQDVKKIVEWLQNHKRQELL